MFWVHDFRNFPLLEWDMFSRVPFPLMVKALAWPFQCPSVEVLGQHVLFVFSEVHVSWMKNDSMTWINGRKLKVTKTFCFLWLKKNIWGTCWCPFVASFPLNRATSHLKTTSTCFHFPGCNRLVDRSLKIWIGCRFPMRVKIGFNSWLKGIWNIPIKIFSWTQKFPIHQSTPETRNLVMAPHPRNTYL